ncbi:hypothetical protein GALL_495690 [mine drainage metagenome]|uniref:Acetyl-CoA dehydrogenase-like C-terminal domain-containing protein n=1 Tax=mine drainage metagenome TaxID=410659 RepID=A0A1J5PU71_9ZZZZ
MGRKTVRDGGALALHFARRVQLTEERLEAEASTPAAAIAAQLAAARTAYAQVVQFIAVNGKSDPNAAYAGSVPYLMLAGTLLAGWQMAQSWLAAGDLPATDAVFAQSKRATAAFYCAHILPRCGGLRDAVLQGADSVMALPVEAF